MASHAHIIGSASALPLHVALSVIPSLPRPLLARLVERAIERLDAMDGDPELEPDDPPEDEHDAEQDNDGDCGEHGIDQRIAATVHSLTPWHIDRERHT